MDNHTVLTLTGVDPPDAPVQQVGFEPSDPYVEQCWSPVIGAHPGRHIRAARVRDVAPPRWANGLRR